MLTKYGTSNIIIMLVAAGILIIIGYFSKNDIVKYVLVIPGIVLALFTFWFFRDPERTVPEKALLDKNIVIAPADGKVVMIKEVYEDKYIKETVKRVSIFLSPLDVHVNRSPVTGIVEYFMYYPGDYLVAYHPKASELNEHTKIGVNTGTKKVLFTQIVGILARRIAYDVKEGDSLTAGEKFGMMKFGSRMDVYLELDTKIKVKEGQRVVAGESIIAELAG